MTNPNNDKLQRKILVLHKKEEEDTAKILASKFKLPYVNLALFPIETDDLKIIPEEKARFGGLAIFQAFGKQLKIAVRNPEKEETAAILKRLEEDRYAYELFFASKSSLEHAWEFYKKIRKETAFEAGVLQVSSEKISSLKQSLTTMEKVRERIKNTFYRKTTEALEVILAGALAVNSSDVHIEPQTDGVRLRFRIDGVLQDTAILPRDLYGLLLSRIKLVSELKLNVHAQAQDGRFTIHTADAEIEVRTSVLPGPYGENVVLRVLDPDTIRVSFESLGMQPWTIEDMKKELSRSEGMILTTGPTGSGKTTTLYAFVQKVYTPEIKIITIEDPREYHLRGIEQTQVEPERGYDFANGLKAIVRQDPDVILVGEIRDIDTAETAMHAALTGHLVFSTLHTNNAAGTIPRLLDLGVKPAIIAPAINVSMAQRLVRRLCDKCKKIQKVGAAEEEKIKKELSLFPPGVPVPKPNDWKIFKTPQEECLGCHDSGYKGRIGVFEMILINERVEKLILKEPSEFEIKKEATDQGQITIRQDGLLKVLNGITDFPELDRVIGIGE